ncbi:MAG: tRNA pseudouridine(55) synthase TruB [Clostridia bacterium]|nr:tRNA pseudouridine(55) synthase TruB [Clostridia bacterium]
MSVSSTEISGAIVINKPSGITSHDVVWKLRKLYKTKQVGHTGTLDPLATGVLIVLIGKSVKASELLMAERKGYQTTLKLGVTSDTEDITGNLTYTNANIPEPNEVLKTIDSFVGEIEQIPPMYSALKVGGKKLVDLARDGIVIEREPRKITIHSIKANGNGDTYTLDVECSKGTYIRTLCADIGNKLGCGAVMSSLNRTHVGSFDINNSYTLEQLENMTDNERINCLIDKESLFSDLSQVHLADFFSRLCVNGCEIYQKKIHTNFETGTMLKVYGSSGFLGIGEVFEYPEGSAIKLQVRL